MKKIQVATSNKSATTTLLLCVFLGALGAHRFYVGKLITGTLMFLTLGGFGVWTLIDLILIARCDFTDSKGNYLIFIKDNSSPLKLIFIVFGCGIVAFFSYAILLFLLIISLTNPMTDVIQKQLSALHAGDFAKAYSYMASETTSTVSMNDFKNYVSRYPILTNSTDTSFPERKFENNTGYVKATLETKNSEEATVEYTLSKEGGNWKIVAIHVSRVHSEASADNNGAMKTYQDKADHYVIQYPSDWYFEQTADHAVMFSGKENTPSYASAITIQAIPSKSSGGIYANVNVAINDLKKKITEQTTDAKFLDTGAIELPKEAKKIHGEYFIATYKYEGHSMKKMQFMLSREGEPTIYSWSYTTTAEQFEKDLPVAKSMYESWKIE